MPIGLSHNPCADNFAKLLVGNCYRSRFEYGRMAGDNIFDLDREQVLQKSKAG
jgi:hypothetical protein